MTNPRPAPTCDGCEDTVPHLFGVRVSLTRTYQLCAVCYQAWLVSPAFRARFAFATDPARAE